MSTLCLYFNCVYNFYIVIYLSHICYFLYMVPVCVFSSANPCSPQLRDLSLAEVPIPGSVTSQFCSTLTTTGVLADIHGSLEAPLKKISFIYILKSFVFYRNILLSVSSFVKTLFLR